MTGKFTFVERTPEGEAEADLRRAETRRSIAETKARLDAYARAEEVGTSLAERLFLTAPDLDWPTEYDEHIRAATEWHWEMVGHGLAAPEIPTLYIFLSNACDARRDELRASAFQHESQYLH